MAFAELRPLGSTQPGGQQLATEGHSERHVRAPTFTGLKTEAHQGPQPTFRSSLWTPLPRSSSLPYSQLLDEGSQRQDCVALVSTNSSVAVTKNGRIMALDAADGGKVVWNGNKIDII